MPAQRFSTRLVCLALAAAIALGASSCGTFLYPERRGQPRGVIDPGVLLLDAVGLIFFVIPGLVAFAVDFSTGAIYLPPAYSGPVSQETLHPQDFVEVRIPKDDLTREKIEQVVGRHTGQPVSLEPGQYRTGELNSLDEFGEQAARLDDAPAPRQVKRSGGAASP